MQHVMQVVASTQVCMLVCLMFVCMLAYLVTVFLTVLRFLLAVILLSCKQQQRPVGSYREEGGRVAIAPPLPKF